jgi:hypothetical protein
VLTLIDRYTLRHYLTGATAARTGDEMSGPALLLLGLSVTGSPALGSALLAGLTISSGVGGPVLGAILDRSPAPGRLLGLALVAYAPAQPSPASPPRRWERAGQWPQQSPSWSQRFRRR